MTETEIKFLEIFPPSKKVLQMDEIYARAEKVFISQKDSLTLLTNLNKQGDITGRPLDGFAITDKGLNSLQTQNDRTEKEEVRERKREQVLDLTIEDLVDKVIDQPKVKNRLLRAEIISLLSALAAILTAILSMNKC